MNLMMCCVRTKQLLTTSNNTRTISTLSSATHGQASFWQFMMAAAVDNESVESGERYFEATSYADNTYVVHSKNDGTLSGGYRVLEWDRALGHSGPENVDDIDNRTKVIN